jgi:uncharacterized protein (DUF433 family)
MPVVPLEYIEVDDRGVAKLIGTRIKVQHLVAVQQANGLSAEELLAEYPELPPAQVYAALSYYHANKAAVDAQIEESVRFADEMRATNPNRLTRDQWRELWKARVPDRPFPGDERAGEG